MKSNITALLKLALLGAAFALASCNTVKGVGRDIEDAGEAIESSASQ